MPTKTFAVAALAAIGLTATLASPILATGGTAPTGPLVPPSEWTSSSDHEVTCYDVGGFLFTTAAAIYDPATGDFTSPHVFDNDAGSAVLVVVDNDRSVAFMSAAKVGAVIVKGGGSTNVYDYSMLPAGGVHADSGLVPPGDPIPILQSVTFCGNEEPPTPEAWCSPGYWRQPQHLAAWEATGYSTTDKYSAVIGPIALNKQGQKNKANPDPSLLEVLQSPQYYGGDAFNKVGDLLSAAHPDVNFQGTRIEDSCPLN
jgi:hypothetical protein